MNSSLSRIYREADRIMAGVAWALFVLSMALASWYGTWTLALTVGGSLSAASTVALVSMPTRRRTRVLNAVVLIGFSALLIHQAHGMIEMHFIIFVLLAFLLYYRDWLALVTGAAVAAVHHFLFFYLQSEGAPVFIFNHAADIAMVFIHAAFVVAETTLLVYMAVRSSREALDADVSALGSRASANGDIDLSIVKGSAVGKSAQDFEDFLLGIGNAVAGTRIVAADVHSTSQLLGQATEQIRVNADETSSLASLASTAAESVSKSIGVVASGSEQLQNSMHSISDSANEAARVAKSAVEIAHETNVTVGKLGESSEEIGQFVKVITSIAQQTNLLALNATIESARAGDAGKGFAVVANEVKELAKATAKATEEIGKKIHAIRADTQAAVAAIENIGNVINQINHISNTITSAVEQQIATTSEVTRNVGDAATSANDIAANMSRVVQAAQNTTSRIGETQDASRVLAVTASKLETLVGKFKLQPQSATETLQLRSAAAGR